MLRKDVELQINLAPTDLPHAQLTLPHQIRCWGGQVDAIQLTLDVHGSRGRHPDGWELRLSGMRRLLDALCEADGRARVVEVDYSAQAMSRVSVAFFGGRPVPAKDRYGAFYPYFFGLHAAQRRYVLHMDSDMLYGGGSQTWVSEAVDVLERRPEVLACNPLPGPPTNDGALRSQTLERDGEPGLAFRSPALSTRIFLVDRERFAAMTPVRILRPRPHHTVQCWLEGRPAVRVAEECISAAMARQGVWRVDMLGRDPGVWSVHPPYRSTTFYDGLAHLISRVESGDVPEEQRGRHDVSDSLVDWSDVRPRRSRRLARHARLVAARLRF